MCQLREVVIQTVVNKGRIFDSPEHALPIEVRLCHLEGTLIPFGNVDHHCDGKALGTVPLTLKMGPEFQSINLDYCLLGCTCYFTRSQIQYFVKSGQKYF